MGGGKEGGGRKEEGRKKEEGREVRGVLGSKVRPSNGVEENYQGRDLNTCGAGSQNLECGKKT